MTDDLARLDDGLRWLPFAALALEGAILVAAAGVCDVGLHLTERERRPFRATDGLLCGTAGGVAGALAAGAVVGAAAGIPITLGVAAAVLAAALAQGAAVGVAAWRLGVWAARRPAD
ncbi:MAG TPA: hypothetical protein VKA84_27935 [Gemmatimonadaceae bacterium]|nr:hypothetical protein [Gemmatimonadaceae bacterium]